MIAIFKREIRNYLKRPLFWVGVLLVIYGVFNATSPYLTTHYLTTGEEIINDQSNTWHYFIIQNASMKQQSKLEQKRSIWKTTAMENFPVNSRRLKTGILPIKLV